ncbi:MAG: hypothetical protein JXB49_06280 [Bacteroidales bacterium]|nr:hypothetical protein [Bacteroidales bacterium]
MPAEEEYSDEYGRRWLSFNNIINREYISMRFTDKYFLEPFIYISERINYAIKNGLLKKEEREDGYNYSYKAEQLFLDFGLSKHGVKPMYLFKKQNEFYTYGVIEVRINHKLKYKIWLNCVNSKDTADIHLFIYNDDGQTYKYSIGYFAKENKYKYYVKDGIVVN